MGRLRLDKLTIEYPRDFEQIRVDVPLELLIFTNAPSSKASVVRIAILPGTSGKPHPKSYYLEIPDQPTETLLYTPLKLCFRVLSSAINKSKERTLIPYGYASYDLDLEGTTTIDGLMTKSGTGDADPLYISLVAELENKDMAKAYRAFGKYKKKLLKTSGTSDIFHDYKKLTSGYSPFRDTLNQTGFVEYQVMEHKLPGYMWIHSTIPNMFSKSYQRQALYLALVQRFGPFPPSEIEEKKIFIEEEGEVALIQTAVRMAQLFSVATRYSSDFQKASKHNSKRWMWGDASFRDEDGRPLHQTEDSFDITVSRTGDCENLSVPIIDFWKLIQKDQSWRKMYSAINKYRARVFLVETGEHTAESHMTLIVKGKPNSKVALRPFVMDSIFPVVVDVVGKWEAPHDAVTSDILENFNEVGLSISYRSVKNERGQSAETEKGKHIILARAFARVVAEKKPENVPVHSMAPVNVREKKYGMYLRDIGKNNFIPWKESDEKDRERYEQMWELLWQRCPPHPVHSDVREPGVIFEKVLDEEPQRVHNTFISYDGKEKEKLLIKAVENLSSKGLGVEQEFRKGAIYVKVKMVKIILMEIYVADAVEYSNPYEGMPLKSYLLHIGYMY